MFVEPSEYHYPPATSNIKNAEVWFDAIDYVEIEETWFDAQEYSSTEDIIPLTEDCLRCMKELMIYWGEIKTNELIFKVISNIFSELSTDIIITARSIYLAFIEKRNPDIAILNTLGFISSHLLGNVNIVSELAHYIKETLLHYADLSGIGAFTQHDDNPLLSNAFTAFSIMAIITKYWMTENTTPQRRLLRLPAFLGHLVIRASNYWNQLGKIADNTFETCHMLIPGREGDHHYQCVKERVNIFSEKSKWTETQHWHCTQQPKSENKANIKNLCQQNRGISSHSKSSISLGQINSAAVKNHNKDVTLPFLSAASVAALGSRSMLPNSKVVQIAIGAVASTVSIIGGKFILDKYASSEHKDNITQSTDNTIISPLVQQQPPIRFRNRLIGYLIKFYPEIQKNIVNKELAHHTLRLIKNESSHEEKISHISLYATTLFGESHNEAINPKIQTLLVGNLLSKMLFNKTVSDYLLNKFAENRNIALKDYHKKITEWSFDDNNSHELVKFYNERYVFPLMPLLSLKISRTSDVMTGSITWLLLYLGSQAKWLNLVDRNEEEIISAGVEIIRLLSQDGLTLTSKPRIEMGLRYFWLFSNLNATPEKFPSIRKLWKNIRSSLIDKSYQYTHLVNKITTINQKLSEAEKEPWYSKEKLAIKLLSHFCKNENPKIYLLRGGNEKSIISKAKFIELTSEHAYCDIIDKNRTLIIKIPTVPYRYETIANNYLMALKTVDVYFLEKILYKNEILNKNIRHDSFDFIEQSALKVINIHINRKRDVREFFFTSFTEKWVPKKEYIFFNASNGKESRMFVINNLHTERLTEINTHNLLKSIKPYFETWPEYEPNMLTIHTYTFRDETAITSRKEPTSLFIKKIAQKNHNKNKEMLYELSKREPLVHEKIITFLKNVLIPFYSCIVSIQNRDATGTFSNCFLDLVFIIFPAARQGSLIIKNLEKTLIETTFKISKNPAFIKETTVLNAIITGSIPWKKIINDAYIRNEIGNQKSILTTSIFQIIIDSLDPGISVTKELKKVIYEMGTLIIEGNLIPGVFHLISNTNDLFRFSIRLDTVVDNSLVFIPKIKQINAFDNHTLDHIHSNLDGTPHTGHYFINIKIDNHTTIELGDTGELSPHGDNIYVMLNEAHQTGILNRFTLNSSIVESNPLIPLIEAEFNKDIIHYSQKTSNRRGQTRIVFNAIRDVKEIIFYPNHKCTLLEDGFNPPKPYEIVKINNVHYIFDSSDFYLRPLFAGDNALIHKREDIDEDIWLIKRGTSRGIFFEFIPPQHHSNSIFNIKKYSTEISDCPRSDTLGIDYSDNTLIARVEGWCTILDLSPIKNRFIINNEATNLPSFPVGWDSMTQSLAPIRPFIKDSSIHVGISLESFIESQLDCHGITIGILPPQLLNGAVVYNDNLFLKILNKYYRLGKPVNGFFPLYCHNEKKIIATWLYYDCFIESFERVLTNEHIPTVDKTQTHSPFEKLINTIYVESEWPNIDELVNLNQSYTRQKIILRLRQAAFLHRLNPVDRMETLLLPSALVSSFSLHSEVVSFRQPFPVLALWVTWQRRLKAMIDSTTLHKMHLVDEIPLINKFVNSHSSLGNLVVGGFGDHEAIWLNNDINNENTVGVLLSLYASQFYGQNITTDNNMMRWMFNTKKGFTPTITQFTYNINSKLLPVVDIYKKELNIIHPRLGLLKFNRYEKNSVIDSIIYSPSGVWVGVIDRENFLTTYQIKDEESNTLNNSLVHPYYFIKVPEEVKEEELPLCIIDDDGFFYYPTQSTWENALDDHFFWSPPPQFSPIFISPDQRFLGFKHKDQLGVKLYDKEKKISLFIQRPPALKNQVNVTSVALSPLNALIALAFDDDHIFLYDLIHAKPNSIINPISSIQLQKITDAESENESRYPKPIVMRFKGFFEKFTVIHAVGTFSTNNTLKNITFVHNSYDISS